MTRAQNPILFMLFPVTLVILTPFGLDFLLPAVPNIIADFNTDAKTAQLSISLFFLALGLGQIPCGMFSDRFGRRASAFLGLLLFFIASLIGYFTTSIGLFLATRFIQGLGAITLTITAFSTVRDFFEADEISSKFSWLVASLNVTSTFATLISAAAIYYWGWRSIIMIYIILTALVFLLVFFGLKETRAPDLRKMVGISNFPKNFAKIVKTRESWPAAVVSASGLAFIISYFTLCPIVLIQQLGLSPLQFSQIFSFNSAIIMVASLLVPKLNTMIGVNKVIIAGIFFILTSCLGLCFIGFIEMTSFWQFMIPIAIGSIGYALIYGNSEGAAIAPQGELAGTAIGILGTIKLIFSAFAAAIIVLLYNGSTLFYGASFFIIMGLALLYWRKSQQA